MTQIAEDVGYPVHEGAREDWRAVFETMALQSCLAGLTRAQTARDGLALLGDEGPVAVLGRFDNAIEHLGGLIGLLELGRDRVELAMSGAIDRAFVGGTR